MSIVKINSLGVNLTSPTTFSAGTAALPSITFSGDTNTGVFAPAADTIGFTEGGSEAMRIDSSARVGIGVTSPIQKLQLPENTNVGFVGGTNSAKIGGIIFGTDSNFVRYGMIDSFRGADAAGIDLRFYTMAGDVEGIKERMRITNAGNLCINSTTSAISGITDGYIGIDVSNASKTGININSVTENQPAIGIRKHNSTGTSYPLYMLNAANSNVGSVSMTNSAVAFNTSSDYRLKENVNYNFDATTRLKQLKPARFNFISDANKTVDGFLAHEVESIIPEAITGKKDAVQVWREGEELPEGISVGDNKLDKNGNTIPVYQGIDQAKLTPILTKALQEAIAKIEQLEARLTALES